MIELHFSSVSPLDPAAFEVSCVEHTEDIKVFAAVGVFLQDQALCYAELHDTAVINQFDLTDELLDRASAPIFSVPARASRSVEINIQTLVDSGHLEAGQQIAIHGLAGNEAIHEEYRRAIEDAGVEIVSDTTDTASLDTVEITNEAAIQAERWTADGATAVLGTAPETAATMFSGTETAGLEIPILLPTGLDRPPSLIIAQLGTTETFQFGVPLIVEETAVPQWNDDVNGVRECAARFEEATGETIYTTESGSEPLENLGPTMVACGLVEFFVALAIEAGPELTTDALASASETIGQFPITGVSSGSLGPNKPDYSDAEPRVGTYNPDTEQFEPVD